MVRTEIFGPVITVQAFGDEDEARALGQRHRLRPGLERVDAATTSAPCACPARLDFGCVWINCHIPLVAEMPHGGFKQSGYGKDLSQYSLEEYTRVKHVMSALEELTR